MSLPLRKMHLVLTKNNKNTVVVRSKCKCGKAKSYKLNKEAYNRWREGTLIQECFPELSADDRERLISGICPKCWDTMFQGN